MRVIRLEDWDGRYHVITTDGYRWIMRHTHPDGSPVVLLGVPATLGLTIYSQLLTRLGYIPYGRRACGR